MSDIFALYDMIKFTKFSELQTSLYLQNLVLKTKIVMLWICISFRMNVSWVCSYISATLLQVRDKTKGATRVD